MTSVAPTLTDDDVAALYSFRALMLRCLVLAALLAVAAVSAAAQESPELPARGALQEGGAVPITFTKGRGPGHGNSYLERFEEDYSDLRDPAKATGPFDPLKYI